MAKYKRICSLGGIEYPHSGQVIFSELRTLARSIYSGNIGAWQVNADCSLTFIAAYVPSVGADSNLAVTPNGRFLVVSGPEAAESFAIGSTGELTDLGSVSFINVGLCGSSGCEPTGIDFTKDSNVAVLACISNNEGCVLTANLNSSGTLSNPQAWSLSSSPEVFLGMSVRLSANAYNGSGFLYVGLIGGEVTANFTESPLNISFANSTSINTMSPGLTSTGNILLMSDDFANIHSFRINADGSLTPLSQVFDSHGDPLYLTVYPNAR